ncbi:hypothetical protein IAU59_005549 [Kwoniella sp. CBS 9459]
MSSGSSHMLLVARGALTIDPSRSSSSMSISMSASASKEVTVPLEIDPSSLPPYTTLLGYVYRPAAVARCFISDVYQLRTVMQASYLDSSKNGQGPGYIPRDIFLLSEVPCKFVEIVAWVAGVDYKESMMTLTLDDGDGLHVLPVIVRLPHVQVTPAMPSPRKKGSTSLSSARKTDQYSSVCSTVSGRSPPHHGKRSRIYDTHSSSSLSVKTNGSSSIRGSKWQYYGGGGSTSASASGYKTYEYKDVRVGDTLRVVGKVDEWFRRKADGSGERVRQVVVDENAGGSVAVVDPEEQYTHVAEVMHLHETKYNQPFVMPDTLVPTTASSSALSRALRSSIKDDRDRDEKHSVSLTLNIHDDVSVAGESRSMFEHSRSTELYSEPPSELTIIDSDIELRDPNKLRSSQLTDRTFRQYMLDHMTQETIRAIRLISETASGASPDALRLALELLFPEYRDANERSGVKAQSKGKSRPARVAIPSYRSIGNEARGGVFTPSKRINSVTPGSQDDHSTPTQSSYNTRKSALRSINPLSPSGSSTPVKLYPQPPIQAFTISALLLDERLNTLAGLVVDNEARKEDRRRRRRIRDGCATKKDLAIEEEMKARDRAKTTSTSTMKPKTGDGAASPLLDEKERRKKMERLAGWAIRAVAEEGSLIQVKISSDLTQTHDQENSESYRSMTRSAGGSHTRTSERNKVQYGYLPVPPELLFPLLIPHLDSEKFLRENTIRPRGDPRTGNGMTVDELVAKMRRWGDEGRWERLGDWTVEEAVEWGEAAGSLKREGKGWWAAG